MRATSMAAVIFALAAGLAAAGEPPRLVNEKAAFGPAGPSGRVAGARLSPDGRHLLYARGRENQPKPEGYTGRWGGRVYHPVLRDLATGTETVLPGPAWTWDDPLRLMLAREVFSADGRSIVLGVGTDPNGDGIHQDRGRLKEPMQPMLYDVATGKPRRLPLTGEFVLPAFIPGGKELLIATGSERPLKTALYLTPAGKVSLKKLSGGGIPMNVCPTARIVPLWVPPKGDPEENPWRFRLHDLKADRAVGELPIHPRNTSLDDYTPQWTAGGRYLYYVDYQDAGGPGGRRKRITRIWDRQAGKEAGIVDGAVAVGPGPGPTTMVVDAAAGTLELHNAATMSSRRLTGELAYPLFAAGGKVIYRRREAGKWQVFIAEIAAPKAGKSEPKPQKPPS